MTLTRQIAFIPLVGIIFLSVSGGSYSLEELVSASGPGLAFLLLLLVPIFYGIPIAAITTELATAIPAEGGTYEWMKRTLGNFMAFQAGVLRWVNSWVDMAIYPVLFTSYLAAFFPSFFYGDEAVFFSFGPLTLDRGWIVGVVLVIIPMALLNIRGARSVGQGAVIFTVLSLIPLALITVIGIGQLFAGGINPFVPFVVEDVPPGAAIAVGLSLVMWSYCGFDQVGLIAGEIKDPAKTIPKAMAVSMIVIAVAYILPLLGGMATQGWENWYAGSYVDIGLQLAGPWLGIAVAVGGAIAALGIYASLLLSTSRVPFVLARDAWITTRLAKQSPRTGSPVTAIVVSSVIYAFFTMGSFVDLVIVNVFLINLLLLMNVIALFVLRIRQPDLYRPVRIPFGWWGMFGVSIPLVAGIVYLIVLQVAESGVSSLPLIGGTLLIAVLAYFPARAYQRRHAGDAVLLEQNSSN